MGEFYLGLMSGTSQDGVDAALVKLDDRDSKIHRTATTPYPDTLRRRIEALLATPEVSLEELGGLDVAIARFFADCVVRLLSESGLKAGQVAAIGHSGHTVFHRPAGPEPFSMQLGDPSTVAARTGITTVGHLRQMDVALGGQGAPLAPAFHRWAFADPRERRVVVNIGGIANVSILDPDRALSGFDTGPGNTLLDRWTRRCTGRPYDHDGDWSRTGTVHDRLLNELLADPYFRRPPPKSTGLEHFNLDWLQAALGRTARQFGEADVQATLTELTAVTIAMAIRDAGNRPERVIVCGGGARNGALRQRLAHHLGRIPLESSTRHGIEPEWVEAVLFAWLARARLNDEPGNAPSVTGASRPATLGGVYYGVRR